MEATLNAILAQVFNLESPDSIRPTDSLIQDLGADSLDFVEILHLVERNFGVVIRAGEILAGTLGVPEETLFEGGRLTAAGAERLRAAYAGREASFREGMGKVELFSLLTVGDLAAIVRAKLEGEAARA